MSRLESSKTLSLSLFELHSASAEMVRSPWSDKKVSGRVGYNSVAEGGWQNMPCPDRDFHFTPRRPSFHGMETNESPLVGRDKKSTRVCFTWCKQHEQLIFVNKKWLLIELSYFIVKSTPHPMEWLVFWSFRLRSKKCEIVYDQNLVLVSATETKIMFGYRGLNFFCLNQNFLHCLFSNCSHAFYAFFWIFARSYRVIMMLLCNYQEFL
jgi:hypothetical protein